ncbi:MAG: hypothetical protein ACKOZT_06280 [Cyanobium sp.]
MPSTASLLLNLLFSSFGAGYLLYGRRNAHGIATLCGLLLMVVPLLVSAVLPLLLIGSVLLAAPFLWRG